MELLVPILIAIFFGFLLGYFLATSMLVMFTVVSIVIVGLLVLLSRSNTEKALILILAVCAIVANLVMWVTHDLVTTQSWIGDYLHGSIFR